MPRRTSRELEATLSHERLRELLHYDPEIGEFTWLQSASNRAPKGSRAGSYNQRRNARYVILSIDRNDFTGHRLAWFYTTGEWPEYQIDHIDGDGWNNCWNNLRPATHQQNGCNVKRPTDNKTGVKGVCFYPKQNKYRVWLNHLGGYATLAEAKAARESAARAAYGEFYREQEDAILSWYLA